MSVSEAQQILNGVRWRQGQCCIRDTSLPRHFDRQLILDPAFSYRHQFREFVERMDSFLRGNPGDDDMGKILDDMHGKAGRILKTDFDVRGHRTLERLLNDCSVPFLIGDHEADDTLRRALLEGKWIYFPGLSAKMPGLRYIHADKTCDRVMAYKNPPRGSSLYTRSRTVRSSLMRRRQ